MKTIDDLLDLAVSELLIDEADLYLIEDELSGLRKDRVILDWLHERHRHHDLRMDGTSIHYVQYWRGLGGDDLRRSVLLKIAEDNDEQK
jgi:hypothetical protein